MALYIQGDSVLDVRFLTVSFTAKNNDFDLYNVSINR